MRSDGDRVFVLLPGHPQDDPVTARGHGVDPEAIAQAYRDAIHGRFSIGGELEEQEARGVRRRLVAEGKGDG